MAVSEMEYFADVGRLKRELANTKEELAKALAPVVTDVMVEAGARKMAYLWLKCHGNAEEISRGAYSNDMWKGFAQHFRPALVAALEAQKIAGALE